MSLGDRIKERRIALDMSQAQLGKFCGITQAQVSKYEMGLAEPVASNLVSIADALDVSIDWLLGRVNDFQDVPQRIAEDLSERERQIILLYRTKSEEKKKAVFNILKVM